MRTLQILLITSIIGTAAAASATEDPAPCTREGSKVVCAGATFDRIVSDLISAERDRALLRLDVGLLKSDLALEQAAHAADSDRLNALVIVWRNRANAAGYTEPEITYPRSRTRWAVGSGIVGTAAVATGVALLATGKPAALGWGTVVAGAGGLGVGVALAF